MFDNVICVQPVDEQLSREFDKFLKKFSLGTRGTEIGELLDVEPDVSRYYAELVPIQMAPEVFWARYFAKLSHFSCLSFGYSNF